MRKKLNWKLYGILFGGLIVTVAAIVSIYYLIPFFIYEIPLYWIIIFLIIVIIVSVFILVIVFLYVIRNGYRKRISTRLTVIVIIIGISIPFWFMISEPLYKPGRNTLEIFAQSLNGNHTMSIDYKLDFSLKYRDVRNISKNYSQNFLDIEFKIRGNVSLSFYGLGQQQLYWRGLDSRIQFTSIDNMYIFKFNKTLIDSDTFILHVNEALTKPNSRLYALSIVLMVDNYIPTNRVLNLSQSIDIKGLFSKKVSIDSTNLALIHIRDDQYTSQPIMQRYASDTTEIIFYNIDLDFSTRWTRFLDEVTLIFLAIFIEPLLEIRAIVIDLTKRLEEKKETQPLTNQSTEQEISNINNNVSSNSTNEELQNQTGENEDG